jgi:ATP-binding cassette subfamily F protein uup
MVAQRGRGIGRKPAATGIRDRPTTRQTPPQAGTLRAVPAATETTAGGRREPRRRLSFADQHALKTLPAKIAALSAEIRRLEEPLSDATLYRRDPKSFTALSAALAAARREAAKAEDEWLRAELLREEIEGT